MPVKNRIYIIIGLFSLAALCLVVLAVLPLLNNIKDESNQYSMLKNSAAVSESQFVQASKFEKDYQNYKSNLDKADRLFVDSNNPVDFIEFLERTANDAGIQLQISPPTFSKDEGGYATFQLSYSGDFPKIMKFLRNLEFGPYLVDVQTLAIGRPTAAQKTSGETQANLLIKVLTK